MDLKKIILTKLEEDDERMQILKAVQSLNLPDGWIGAGFVRNLIWDFQSSQRTSLSDFDIDVLYYQMDHQDEHQDVQYQEILSQKLPNYQWSVKNQARMHLRNEDLPYQNTLHAIEHWPETATAIIVRWNKNVGIELQCPFGLEDAFNLILRPTPHIRSKLHVFNQRILSKNWQKTWPGLKVEY